MTLQFPSPEYMGLGMKRLKSYSDIQGRSQNSTWFVGLFQKQYLSRIVKHVIFITVLVRAFFPSRLMWEVEHAYV
jgi:hypothetical protein